MYLVREIRKAFPTVDAIEARELAYKIQRAANGLGMAPEKFFEIARGSAIVYGISESGERYPAIVAIPNP